MTTKPSHLILNSPFVEPRLHWEFVRATLSFRIAEGRRKSGYVQRVNSVPRVLAAAA